LRLRRKNKNAAAPQNQKLHLEKPRAAPRIAYCCVSWKTSIARELGEIMSAGEQISKCVCGVSIEPDGEPCEACMNPSFTLSQMYPVFEYDDDYQAEINSDEYIAYLNNN
jgi:recombinational DNA repair protein RecR